MTKNYNTQNGLPFIRVSDISIKYGNNDADLFKIEGTEKLAISLKDQSVFITEGNFGSFNKVFSKTDLQNGYFNIINIETGELTENNLVQRCRFFGDKEKLMELARKLFEFKEDCLVNNSWLSQIKGIKEKSEKRKDAANARWQKEQEKEEKPKETKDKPKKPVRFIEPTLEEIKTYCQERSSSVDANKFLNFYQSKGWMIGKSRKKDWKASVRSWENNKEKPIQNNQTLCQEINKLAGGNLITKIEAAGKSAQLYFENEDSFEKLKKLETSIKDQIKKTIGDKLGTSELEFKF